MVLTPCNSLFPCTVSGYGFNIIFTVYLAAINVCEQSHGGKYIFLCFTHYYYDVGFDINILEDFWNDIPW